MSRGIISKNRKNPKKQRIVEIPFGGIVYGGEKHILSGFEIEDVKGSNSQYQWNKKFENVFFSHRGHRGHREIGGGGHKADTPRPLSVHPRRGPYKASQEGKKIEEKNRQ